MRILLAHNSLYFPSHGGGDKSNRLLMAALAGRGHEIRVLARVAEFGAAAHERLALDLAARDVRHDAFPHEIRFTLDGVEVYAFTRGQSLRGWVSTRMEEFHPDAILASTDDPAHLMLQAALRVEHARVVYLIRAIIALPFGPDSPMPSERPTEELRGVDGAVAVSETVAAYARRWGAMEAVYLPISLPDRADFPCLGRFDNRFVTMVNPCAGKGISIFLALARHFPGAEFAAVPTWGTTAADLEALRGVPNVTVMAPADDIDEIYRLTRVAVVPSLWAEARSRIVLEAMARGIPVLASDVGGLAEAMLGMDCLLPVNPASCRPNLDEMMAPVVDVPEQDTRPWNEALGRLLSDRGYYEDLSRRGRATALAFARECTAGPLEAYLEEVVGRPARRRASPGPAGTTAGRLAHGLSPDRRRLLAARLRRRQDGETK